MVESQRFKGSSSVDEDYTAPSLDRETVKSLIEMFGNLGEGTIQTAGLTINGIFNVIGKWIDASGRIYSTTTPFSLGGAIFWTVLNVAAIDFFLTTEPYATIIGKLKLTGLLKRLGAQLASGNIPAPPTIPSTPHQPNATDIFGNPLPNQPGYPFGVLFTYTNPFDLSHPLNGAEYFTTAADRDAWVMQQGSRITVTSLVNPPPPVRVPGAPPGTGPQ